MKSGRCPKCGKKDVRFQDFSHYRVDLRVATFSGVGWCNYVCGECGYVESYAVAGDLQRVRANLPAVERPAPPENA